MWDTIKRILIWIFLATLTCIAIVLASLSSPPPSPPPPSSSRTEDLVCHAFSSLVGREIQRNIRPNFLKNPATRRNLELDCYDPVSKTGIEYDGIQHYQYPNRFHKTIQEFEAQQQRDKTKEELCHKNGVRLIRVPYIIAEVPKAQKYDAVYRYLSEQL
jgi:hypothetical protein